VPGSNDWSATGRPEPTSVTSTAGSADCSPVVADVAAEPAVLSPAHPGAMTVSRPTATRPRAPRTRFTRPTLPA